MEFLAPGFDNGLTLSCCGYSGNEPMEDVTVFKLKTILLKNVIELNRILAGLVQRLNWLVLHL